MARTLRIKDWEKHYETNETRKLVQLRWVKVSNNLNDPGYLSLVVQENGAAMLGVWIAILQLASRCKVRGTLAEGDGTPYTVETIALIVRLPVELVRRAVELLTTQPAWMEWIGLADPTSPGDYPGTTGDFPGCMESNGTEGNLDRKSVTDHQRIAIRTNSAEGARDAQKIAAVTRHRKPADRKFVAKVCWLKQRGLIAEGTLWDALEGVRLSKSSISNPMGYFRTCLKEKLAKSKQDLDRLLADAAIDGDFLEACSRRPEPRLMEAAHGDA